MEKRNCIVCREDFKVEEWHDETDDICDICLKLVAEDLGQDLSYC